MKITPEIPEPRATNLPRVIRSPRNRAASTTANSGWVLPSTDAIPASVLVGLRNMAPSATLVEVKASASTQGPWRLSGSRGSRSTTSTGRAAPPISALNPP
jgi:hypothetical protein